MQEGLDEIESSGARVVAIGQGTGDEAAHYCAEAKVSFDCLGDPERQGYQSHGLRRGSWWSVVMKDLIVHPVESITLIKQADLKAAALKASDPLQLGGMAIVDRSGTLRYRHIAETTDDMPSNEEILHALEELKAA